ncbi:hypothetical protein HMPREF9166_1987 [Selenomonas sp. oral taxon 149 str. 67H29BP]|nr:hypothetical protein HMPREF9166_1987 [Selenomonas sp. oral taxon 149 str. 67H29BP]
MQEELKAKTAKYNRNFKDMTISPGFLLVFLDNSASVPYKTG